MSPHLLFRSSLTRHQVLDVLDPTSPTFRKCLREIRHICGTKWKLPNSFTFSLQGLDIGQQPVTSGGSGDVYEATLNNRKVCVKRVRIYSKDGPVMATKVPDLVVSHYRRSRVP
jgi:hypothetical protein